MGCENSEIAQIQPYPVTEEHNMINSSRSIHNSSI